MKNKTLLLVETNFIMDYGLRRDKNIPYLFNLCIDGKIYLAVPEFSIEEFKKSVALKNRNRMKKLKQTIELANEIERSEHLKEYANIMKSSAKTLMQKHQEETTRALSILDEVIEPLILIPFTADSQSFYTSQEKCPELEDNFVYESVHHFIKTNRKDYDNIIFYTKNKKDFDKPRIIQEMNELKAKIMFSSKECIKDLIRLGLIQLQ
ncbi:MAG: PIN domain-containing protein [Methanosarcinales archaeon]